MNTEGFETWVVDGCGRCDLYRTPACKVRRWTDVLVALRGLLLASGLREEMKWGSPCYTDGGHNVVMLSALKDCAVLGFFKGTLLDDPEGLLEAPGPNTQAARQVRFTALAQVQAWEKAVAGLIARAIEVERSGAAVTVVSTPEPMPEELDAVLARNPAARAAFDALTPGRRRSHILHVTGAKQAATRMSRAAGCVPKILEGRGWHER